MSIRNLDALLDPSSVVVVGASARIGSVGATVWRNLMCGGYEGDLYAVNSKRPMLDKVQAYASVSTLPKIPDLAIVCTPPHTVTKLIEELGALGTRAVIVMTAGLDAAQKQAMLNAAKRYLLRILGPNCVGLLAPHIALNASFAHINAKPGKLAFVSQSGALVTAMLDWAQGHSIGFSSFVSLGEHVDVDFGDMLDYLAGDRHTRAILLYIESITDAKKFMSAARAASRNKPVIVVKAGRSPQGQIAAASHTGALAGSDLVYDAAIARAGMVRVDTLKELFLAAESLTYLHNQGTEAVTILTNGGGAGVLAADAAASMGVKLASLSQATRERLDAVLPANWSKGNPVDIIGDAPTERYEQALQALADDRTCGTVLLIHAPTAIVDSAEIARKLLPLARADASKPMRVMSCWLGDRAVAKARAMFQDAAIADFETPEDAMRAFSLMVRYRKNQAELTQAPATNDGPLRQNLHAARAIVKSALAQQRYMLTEPESKALLQACSIDVVPTLEVGVNPQDAVAAAIKLGFPVVLKILSPDISHKSDAGGVQLDLHTEKAVFEAAQTMLMRVRSKLPLALLKGFTVQTMIRRRHAQELIVGSTIDSVFGPVILFGQGGTAVEVVSDRAVALPPLNTPLAQALISRTRVSRLLDGWRDTPAVDHAALHHVLVAISQLLAEVPEVSELDINPLIVNFEGAIALDARVRLSAASPAGAKHFVIQPYPIQLEEQVKWQGRKVLLRPIRPDDEAMHMEFLRMLDPVDVRMRMFYSKRSMERSELARLVQVDYAREMAFIAVSDGVDGKPETLGVARALADTDNIVAEFGLIVRSDLKERGLGQLLMHKLIAHCRTQGLQQLVASVLSDNKPMRNLAHKLGFSESALGDSSEGVRNLALQLNGAPP